MSYQGSTVSLVIESHDDEFSEKQLRESKRICPPFMYLGWRKEDLPLIEARIECDLVKRATGREGVS